MEILIPAYCKNFDDEEEIDFYHILLQLGKLDCSYLSYSLEKPDGIRLNFFSDKEWLHVYHTEDFIRTCQLAILCRKKGNTIIPWSTLYPTTLEQKRVLDARTDFDIANGITIAQQINGTHEMVALATRTSNPQFISVLQANQNFLQSCLLRLRSIAINSHNL